jgi:putative inorganic carbon (HCO3(-)) transporter
MIQRVRGLAKWILSLELWVVGLAVALTFVYSRALPLAIGIAAFFWLLRGIVHRRLSVSTPADWPIVFLLLMLPVTLWVSIYPDLTRLQVYRLLSGIALYYAVANWATTTNRLRWVVRAGVAAGLALALYGTISVEWFTTKLTFIPEFLYRPFMVLVDDSVNPNVMAGSLEILLPIALALLLFSWRRLRWVELIFTILAALGMLTMLLLTQARGGWITMGIVLLMLVSLRWRWGWMAGVAALVGGAAAVYLIGYQRLLEFVDSASAVESFEMRYEFWQRAVAMIQDFPLTGIGMGSYGEVGDLLYPFIHRLPITTSTHAHNLFLQIAVDLGLPGLIAWLIIFLCVSIMSWRIYRYGCSIDNRWVAGLGAGLLGCQVALAVHGMVEAVTWGMTRTPPLVWFIWGLAVAGANLVAASRRAKQVPDPNINH